MGKKRVFAALLVLAVTVGSLVLPARAAFTDTTGHWAETAITKWSEEYSIINGYEDGTFRPDNSITRGAFAGILDRFLKFQSTSPAGTFSDLSGNYWEDAILKLHASGVYLGNNGQALAGDTITRQQAVTMIARAFNISGESATVYYLDADQVADYAKPYLAEMSALGYITDSSDGYFRPTDAITRAEIVTILDNMIEVLIQTSTTYTQDVEGTVMVNAAEGACLQDMTITGDLILAPGVTGTVTLENVTIQGAVRNFGSAVVTDLSQRPEEPEQPPAIQPGDVYTPSETTGEYLTYSNQQIPIYAGVERNRFSQGDFMWDPDRPDRLIYTGDDYRTRFGIDVSAYQNRASANNTIDWEAAKADGVEFAMVRIGLRGYGSGSIMEDAFYAQNIDGAMAAGIETGVYFFAQAITVEEARDLLRESYVDPIDEEILALPTIQEITDALGDPYTYYMTAEEYQRFQDSLSDTAAVGIGVMAGYSKEGLVVSSVAPDSPATQAGLRVGDAIVAVDGEFLRVGFGCSGHRVLSLWSIAKSTYPTV